MNRILKLNLILTNLFVLSISLYSIAEALNFDTRDRRVDLPILSSPNNAITPKISADQNGHVYEVWSDNRGGLRLFILIQSSAAQVGSLVLLL